ncbi:hypothetical protein [uncultured Fretibacterium sp.]|uniref:hypothetical protein n=1 Tax=uncultured Fretibacterium sp. TaxID=1678694 RepID=UPI00263877DF|nr:hypothetical protein [uncultured Fretibacterium sp.]
MSRKNESKLEVQATTAVKEAYEYKSGLEAVKRVGDLPPDKLKGVVHEVMFKDRFNLKNAFSGKKAILSRSRQAVRDDVLIRDGKKIVERLQLKDTPKSVGDVVRRVKQGQYRATKLLGTEETAKAYNQVATKQGIGKSMRSSKISTNTTERGAAKVKGSMPSAKSLLHGAKQAGKAGAIVSAGIAAATSAVDYFNGEIDEKEAAAKVVSAGVAGYAGGAAGAVASSLAASAVTSGLAAVTTTTAVGGAVIAAAPVVIPIAAAVAVGGLVSGWVGDAVDNLFSWFSD